MTRSEYRLWGARANARRGAQLPQTKLNVEHVRAIRTNRTGMTMRAQAQQFGVHKRTIEKIHYRETWVNV